ncbi:MAG: hypothetical protein ACE5GL_03000 [Calditrichia bacterium]
MEKPNRQKIVYSINVEDIQNVARQELERELSSAEIESIIDLIAENIDWYGAIANAIDRAIALSDESL